ncbi:MAG: hypothetical protein KAT70_05435, partial [Thermoplasmata archaeon]|nr:hypothetical protein [Thermoplasmata archaeon]
TFNEEMKKLKPSAKGFQVAMLHAGVVGVDVFSMGEANENVSSIGPLTQKGFDYVALGHFHRHTEVAKNVVYSGSTERLSFAEAGEKKGCVLVDLTKHRWEFREIDTRPMLDLGPLPWDGEAAEEMEGQILLEIEEAEVEAKIVRLTVKGIPRSVYRSLDHRRIRSSASQALTFQPRYVFAEEDQQVSPGETLARPLCIEYGDFMEGYSVEHLDKKRLSALGREYLDKAGGGS